MSLLGGGYVTNPAGNQIVVMKGIFWLITNPIRRKEFFQPVFVFEEMGGLWGMCLRCLSRVCAVTVSPTTFPISDEEAGQ